MNTDESEPNQALALIQRAQPATNLIVNPPGEPNMTTDTLTPTTTALAINGQRLWDSLMTLAQIGATD